MSEYFEHLNNHGFYEAQPKPNPDALADFYKQKYFQNKKGSYSHEYSLDEVRYFNNVAKVALETIKVFDIDKTLYDIGCGEGFFSHFFYKHQWEVACCDLSSFGIKKQNIDMLPYFSEGEIIHLVNEAIKTKKTYGLINLQNVLEHVIDPELLIAKIQLLMSERSIVRIRVPNDYSDFQQALLDRGSTQNTWFVPPEHLSYFNKDSLVSFLARNNYSVVSLQADFPIEIFLANKHSNYWKNKDLGKEAHLTRVFCENHLIEKNVANYIDYAQAAAKLGFGRELIVYAMKSERV